MLFVDRVVFANTRIGIFFNVGFACIACLYLILFFADFFLFFYTLYCIPYEVNTLCSEPQKFLCCDQINNCVHKN